MEAVFCVDCLKEALRTPGMPEISNSDQGSQFTGKAFTGVLEREGVIISMDGRGRAFDNIFVERLWRSVKHEDVYLKGYDSISDLRAGLTEYFVFYNSERPHQSLGQRTPESVYKAATGGGAVIVDKYHLRREAASLLRYAPQGGSLRKSATTCETEPGQRWSAENELKCTT